MVALVLVVVGRFRPVLKHLLLIVELVHLDVERSAAGDDLLAVIGRAETPLGEVAARTRRQGAEDILLREELEIISGFSRASSPVRGGQLYQQSK
jgi:hypothetical protein